ncbi:hypothetical protein [Sphingomicrobium flavum]|uniref:hypothetical protein n=1 Tax=Sphingomicrobium flavum TaxID=1229164 RepID=UPI0021ADDB9D|nr:hypothetical protein [Sphingomicrobium flavum]
MRALAPLALLALAACEGGEAPVENAAVNEVAKTPPAPIDEQALASVMYEALKDDLSAPDTLQLQTGAADLDGDGEPEVLAYAIDPMICGSGGCSLYVLRRAGSSYRILDQIKPARLPIYKLPAAGDGWAELGVSVSGGGMAAAVMAVPHDGTGYADNPTVEPARAVDPGDAEIIIADPPLR